MDFLDTAKQADVIEAFYSISRYLDDLLTFWMPKFLYTCIMVISFS